MSTPEVVLRRYLRQRRELGETELVLESFSPDDLQTLLSAAPAPAVARPPAPSAAPGRTAGGAGSAGERRAEAASPTVGSLEQLRARALTCLDCSLCESRIHVVFGEGDPVARVMVVGEAPGAEEDRTGRPFVGRAGKLLDRFLESIGFPRESVYICNVLKCRPPGNRNPSETEISACSGYLRRQVELVDPEVILAVGTFPAQTLLGSDLPIGQLRGRVHDYGGRPLVPTYHPAAVLRNPSWIRPVWDDLQRLREVLARA